MCKKAYDITGDFHIANDMVNKALHTAIKDANNAGILIIAAITALHQLIKLLIIINV